MSITLNTDAVQKEFTAGDSLSHEGLIVEEEPADEPVPIDEIFDETEEAAPMSESGSAGEDPNQGASAKSSLSMRRRRNRHKHR